MSIPDSPKIEPCPMCGGVGEPVTLFEQPYISCTVTEHSPYLLPLAEWNRLSRAARLLAAVERLGNRETTALTPLGMLRIDEIHILPEQGSGQWVAVRDGRMTARHATIADALIALAEEGPNE